MRLRGSDRAFSLAEILVVLMILAIGSTIALYSYGSYRNALTVESTGRKLQAVLTTARSQAIARNTPTRVVIDLDRNSFWADELNDAQDTVTRPKFLEEEAAAEFVIIDRLRIDSQVYADGQRSIIFEPDGRGDYVVVHLRREFDDASLDENYTSLRMSPMGTPEILIKTRL